MNLNNTNFNDLLKICKSHFGNPRIKGSHHIFINSVIPELINLQNVNGKAKPYQIRQFLKIVEKYNLQMEDS